MIILKTIAPYFAIIGLILTLGLVKIQSNKVPLGLPVEEPAANPYKKAIAASGIVESADKNIAIGTPEEGVLTRVYVTVGEKVIKGQPLYQMDSRTLEAQLIYQEAIAEVSKATLVRLQDQLKRLQTVEDLRAISLDELKTKENDVRVGQAQFDAAQALLLQTKKLIERLTVKAPKAGVILQNNIREGEFASKTTNTMVLGDLDLKQVRANIDEQNAGLFDQRSKAVAFPKNNMTISIPLTLVRVEPFVLPKVSLTGASDERIDTRVLQVIYSFKQPQNYHIYVGQQVDVFIDNTHKEKADDSV